MSEKVSLKQRKQQLVRDTVYESAQRLFWTHGYEATSVQQIADDAGISRAGFFNYFSGKPQLLALMVEDMNRRFELLIEEQLARPATTQQRLADFISYSCNTIAKSQEFSRVLFMAFWQAMDNPLEKRRAVSHLTATFEKLLAAGVKQGDVRTDISLPVLAQMVAAGFSSLTNHWMNDPKYPLKKRAQEVSLYLCDSIKKR